MATWLPPVAAPRSSHASRDAALRAQSLKQFHLGPGALQYQVDSLTTRVALRR